MSTRNGRILKAALGTTLLALVAGLLALAAFPGASKPLAVSAAAKTLPVFSAPSHVPAGEHWVLLGSHEELPEDLVVAPGAAGVLVLETQRLSNRAVAVRLSAASGVQGKLLQVASLLAGAEAHPDLYQGAIPASRTADGNFTEESFVDGKLVVDGEYFMYGYYPVGERPLAALRIHNRATGRWHSHDHALKRLREAEEMKVPEPPHFVEVDELETLPDTDGNGIPDFADLKFEPPPVPEQLGVEVVAGDNVLDLVAVDEDGATSWRTIVVHSTRSTP